MDPRDCLLNWSVDQEYPLLLRPHMQFTGHVLAPRFGKHVCCVCSFGMSESLPQDIQVCNAAVWGSYAL